MKGSKVYEIIGRMVAVKYQRRIRQGASVSDVAKQLRKQGFPLAFTLLVICGRV